MKSSVFFNIRYKYYNKTNSAAVIITSATSLTAGGDDCELFFDIEQPYQSLSRGNQFVMVARQLFRELSVQQNRPNVNYLQQWPSLKPHTSYHCC